MTPGNSLRALLAEGARRARVLAHVNELTDEYRLEQWLLEVAVVKRRIQLRAEQAALPRLSIVGVSDLA